MRRRDRVRDFHAPDRQLVADQDALDPRGARRRHRLRRAGGRPPLRACRERRGGRLGRRPCLGAAEPVRAALARHPERGPTEVEVRFHSDDSGTRVELSTVDGTRSATPKAEPGTTPVGTSSSATTSSRSRASSRHPRRCARNPRLRPRAFVAGGMRASRGSLSDRASGSPRPRGEALPS